MPCTGIAGAAGGCLGRAANGRPYGRACFLFPRADVGIGPYGEAYRIADGEIVRISKNEA